MSIESLKNAVPGYAKDLKLNLGSLARSTNLDEQKKWGTFLACAAATGSATVLREISEEAGDYLSEEAYAAALAAAAVMGMNNVFYSAKGNMGDDFANERAGLRMNVIANPGVDKADFDLWSFAVSAIGHCEFCTAAHAEDCLKAGISKEGVMDALRIAATTAGLARAVKSWMPSMFSSWSAVFSVRLTAILLLLCLGLLWVWVSDDLFGSSGSSEKCSES